MSRYGSNWVTSDHTAACDCLLRYVCCCCWCRPRLEDDPWYRPALLRIKVPRVGAGWGANGEKGPRLTAEHVVEQMVACGGQHRVGLVGLVGNCTSRRLIQRAEVDSSTGEAQLEVLPDFADIVLQRLLTQLQTKTGQRIENVFAPSKMETVPEPTEGRGKVKAWATMRIVFYLAAILGGFTAAGLVGTTKFSYQDTKGCMLSVRLHNTSLLDCIDTKKTCSTVDDCPKDWYCEQVVGANRCVPHSCFSIEKADKRVPCNFVVAFGSISSAFAMLMLGFNLYKLIEKRAQPFKTTGINVAMAILSFLIMIVAVAMGILLTVALHKTCERWWRRRREPEVQLDLDDDDRQPIIDDGQTDAPGAEPAAAPNNDDNPFATSEKNPFE
ncbi:uncharacterized protein MONBRDRAFT_37493 [Monosiga brevicollis MX1]|uniref:Uncharacterized protein n=1 Tax=Monosiga brevicollis TaxID=81824 RepID=A9V230_MONBE|nr:uncharacterized protein MONBRDRAFT_37493 [Monosiga brevicollis MX1]EDQ88181.1 predicted protein [Monosiga brevicollis MX1]|eukprot:XP_001746774.1 hypothetical protein [Monosiga brevicollis MX1]